MEFYGNLNKNTNFSVVKGRVVDYSPARINEIYNLTDVDDQVTQQFLENPDLTLVENDLCPFGANWLYKSTLVKGSLAVTNVRYRARPILTFVSSRLRPSSNTTKIYVTRLSLTHVICEKKALNVGNMISKNIKYCRFEKHNKNSIWFPSTITHLILLAGVLPTPGAKEIVLDKEINKTFFEKMKNTRGPNDYGENEPRLNLSRGESSKAGKRKRIDESEIIVEMKNLVKGLVEEVKEEFKLIIDKRIDDVYMAQYFNDKGKQICNQGKVEFFPFQFEDFGLTHMNQQAQLENPPSLPPMEIPVIVPMVPDANSNMYAGFSDFQDEVGGYNQDFQFQDGFGGNENDGVQLPNDFAGYNPMLDHNGEGIGEVSGNENDGLQLSSIVFDGDLAVEYFSHELEEDNSSGGFV